MQLLTVRQQNSDINIPVWILKSANLPTEGNVEDTFFEEHEISL
jgi:hypothetical protein